VSSLMPESWPPIAGVILTTPQTHCCSSTLFSQGFNATCPTDLAGVDLGIDEIMLETNLQSAFWDQMLQDLNIRVCYSHLLYRAGNVAQGS